MSYDVGVRLPSPAPDKELMLQKHLREFLYRGIVLVVAIDDWSFRKQFTKKHLKRYCVDLLNMLR